MKLLYATRNAGKIYNMERRLAGFEVELETPGSLGISLSVPEDGRTPAENSLLKAEAYFLQTGIPTVAGDSGLYIDGLPEERQPGLFVRRVNGRELTDDEMIAHYAALAAELGGRARARYVTGLALITEEGKFSCEIAESDIFLVSEPDWAHPHKGNPLDVISMEPETGKYCSERFYEAGGQRKNGFEAACVDFLRAHLPLSARGGEAR